MDNQGWTQDTPIYDALRKYANQNPVRLHVPGHKGRAYLKDEDRNWLTAVHPLDVTELPGLDDLHQPATIIAKAQHIAARCFHSEQTWFTVGGSTVANMAMVLAAANPGEVILVQRGVHQSILHGIMLGGLQVVFLRPCWDEVTSSAVGLDCALLADALHAHPQAKAVVVTSPNYYGVTTNITGLAKVAHEHDVLLLVDEAHGSHFGQHHDLPRSAMQCGADGASQSPHKMLPAMTMTGLLHVQGPRINRQAISYWLRVLQSSSPSYVLLASIDQTRAWLETDGPQSFDSSLSIIFDGIEQSKRVWKTLWWLEKSGGDNGTCIHDPYKMLLRDSSEKINGYELLALFRKYNCYLEMADHQQAVGALSPISHAQDIQLLIHAGVKIDSETRTAEKGKRNTITNKDIYMMMPPFCDIIRSEEWRYHDSSNGRNIPLEEAVDQKVTEWIVPYPPGIPLCCPGERLSQPLADILLQLRSSGVRFQGAIDSELKTIQIE